MRMQHHSTADLAPQEESTDENQTPGILVGKERRPKKVRTRTGCLNCRRKRRKCDETKPVCKDCHRRGEACEWGIRVTFRAENAQTIQDDHPSMQTSVWKKRPRRFEIMNVTAEVVRDYWNDFSSGNISPLHVCPPHIEEARLVQPQENASSSPSESTATPNTSYPAQEFSPYAQESPGNYIYGQVDSPFLQSQAIPGNPHYDPSTAVPASRRVQSAAANLLLLRDPQSDLRLNLNGMSDVFNPAIAAGPAPLHSMSDTTPNFDESSFFEDGIFEPGSTYQELHATLRNHIFSTARSNAPTRQASPEAAHFSPSVSRSDSLALDGSNGEKSDATSLTPEQEFLLWKNYIEEIAPWLDKFDIQCHFAHKLPPLAAAHPHLRYAILALSARQVELKDPSSSSSRSLALYQEAIHLLVPQLQTRNTAVIASCVVLCVLEMMSCSPKAWRRHLDGCASLIEAVGINGFSGGVEQALFWCFIRMDVCGGLISSEKTLVPIEHWASKGSLANDSQAFRSTMCFDMYACYSVYLLGCVLRLFADYPSSRDIESKKYAESWLELYETIENWYEHRPEEMRPIIYIRPDPAVELKPFPDLLFGNAPAVSGNQLYHTAALLMLQKRPSGSRITRKPQSILWHARRICAISMSNTHHGCWTNCVQPLWIAGKVMSHPTEHRAILSIYERIERETGWNTAWRANDLKEFWGNLDD